MLEPITQDKPVQKKRSMPARSRLRPFPLKQAHLRQFLKELEENGRAEETIKKYRSDMNRFYDFLGEDKWVYPDSLARWRDHLIGLGYAARTVNTCVVVINGLYDSIGCWEWQCTEWMEVAEVDFVELTRETYHRLLQEARRQENIQVYLLVKIFACTDLTPGEIYLLTREAVNDAVVTGKKRGGKDTVILPEPLRQDLLEFSINRGIRSGPVFLTNERKPLGRTAISKMISTLGEDLGLPLGIVTPRNLRRLHLNTIGEYQRQADLWIAASYSQALVQEEKEIGWRIAQL